MTVVIKYSPLRRVVRVDSANADRRSGPGSGVLQLPSVGRLEFPPSGGPPVRASAHLRHAGKGLDWCVGGDLTAGSRAPRSPTFRLSAVECLPLIMTLFAFMSSHVT